MADKLTIWNKALRLIGEERLTDTAIPSDPANGVEALYVLNDAWPTIALDGLARGDWNFAIKTAEVTQSGSTTVIPGYEFAYDQPADWVRTIAFSPLADFETEFYLDEEARVYDERGSWFTNLSQLFVRYVSSDFTQDANLSAYPPTYVEFISALLARDICERITQGTSKIQYLDKEIRQRLLKAKSNDARNLKQGLVRPGNWARALRGGIRRRGSIGTLVGGQIQTQQEDI